MRELSGLSFDSYSRIVAYPLADAGQRAEKGRLSRVGVADQGDAEVILSTVRHSRLRNLARIFCADAHLAGAERRR